MSMNIFTLVDNKVNNLANGQLVDTDYLAKEITNICHYVQHVVIGLRDNKYLFALIFPNQSLFKKPDYTKIPEEGCFCPRNMNELGKCLSGCIESLNSTLPKGYAKIHSAMIINTELSVLDSTLTPALHTIPENVMTKYSDHIKNLFGEKIPVKEESFKMKIA